MRLGIIANMNRPDAANVIRRIIKWSEKNDVELSLCARKLEKNQFGLPIVSCDEIPLVSDVIVSLGGDGTLLGTARAVRDHGTLILGINLGSLGFLTQLTPSVVEETLTNVLHKKYFVEKRMVAEVELEGSGELPHPYALNDIVVDRGSVSRLINLDVYANDYFICSYSADGLIVSTPTGSTAYSLAVGGPILNPLMNAFIISPISPFSLTIRPIVFSENDELRIVARSNHSDPVLTLDGQVSCNLTQESSFIVRKADYSINFIVFRKNSFYDVLRSKLHWGRLPEGSPGKPKYF
ncbi:MAG: NAD(+)/NADH kinase [candidate division Zixibacteria bacterium]|nr:NAD(+)/NADH kinase [candidate division Zixibacteria bacterium]